jgi:hypothetical protein
MADPRFPDEDTRSYPRPPAQPGPPAWYGEPPGEPQRGGSGWMIAFFALLLLVVAAVLVWFFVVRNTGGGPEGAVEPSPRALDFGDQDLGERSAVQTVTVRNGTGADVTLGTIEVGGENPDDFAVTEETTCRRGRVLADGESCEIGVRFTPHKREPRSAELTVRIAGAAPLGVALHGTGIGQARVQLEATRLDFGTVLVGSTRTLKLALTNGGNAPLGITTISVAGGGGAFRVAKATTCSTERKVKAGASCVLAVAFRPRADARASGTLTVVHDASAEPAEIALRGAGKGTAELTADRTSLDFGDVEVGTTSPPQTLTVTNAGNIPVQLPALRLAGDFALSPESTCADGLALDPGDTCTVEIVFAPSGLGRQVATFGLDVPGGAGTGEIQLSGRGVPSLPAPATG